MHFKREFKKINFSISKSNKYYIAECEEFAIVTKGKTWDELIANINEATELHIETINKYNNIKSPLIFVNFNLAKFA